MSQALVLGPSRGARNRCTNVNIYTIDLKGINYMDTFGLVVHDEETFFNKVVNTGMEQGIFTRDRADEIVRVSVAMANKYVLDREVDFRSSEELATVQEVILKIVGIGLEIKSGGDLEEGLRLLIDASPVDLFRIAYTRIERLRHRWRLLRQDDRIPIFVAPDEFECLDDMSCQLLAQMSVFTQDEITTIESLTLEDRLFSSYSVLEYYESELVNYEFILRLKEILPFDLLNQSPSVNPENLSEVDSVREALVNTVIISGYVKSPDPVSVSVVDVRKFLTMLRGSITTDVIPEELEDVIIDVIHELGEGLDEDEASLLARETIRVARKLMESVEAEQDRIDSESDSVLFKRWRRLAVLSDVPDPLAELKASGDKLDEYAFEYLSEQFSRRRADEVKRLVKELPWDQLMPDQIIRLFQEQDDYQREMAQSVSLIGFSAAELVDFLEILSNDTFKKLAPRLAEVVPDVDFTLEDLEVIAGLSHKEILQVVRKAGPPQDYNKSQILREYSDANGSVRRALLMACWEEPWFPELFQEAWDLNHDFLKRFVKGLPAIETGLFLQAAAGKAKPKVVKHKNKDPELRFKTGEVNELFKSLSKARQKAAVKHFEALAKKN